MNFEIEYEWKCLLTKEQFDDLLESIKPDPNYTYQASTYYDTKDEKLKNMNGALRLRNYTDKSEWTIKLHKTPTESYEYHIKNNSTINPPKKLNAKDLDAENFQSLFKENNLNNEFFEETLTIETKRYLKENKYGLICIDESKYLGFVDYELEFEANKEGLEVVDGESLAFAEFKKITKEHNINYQQAPTKIARASAFYQNLTANKDIRE